MELDLGKCVEFAVEAGTLFLAIWKYRDANKKLLNSLHLQVNSLTNSLSKFKEDITLEMAKTMRSTATLGVALLKTDSRFIKQREEIEELRTMLTALMKFMGEMTPEEKATFGNILRRPARKR